MDSKKTNGSYKITQGDLDEVLHVLKNIAQKNIGIQHFLEGISRIIKSKQHDYDRIWDIIKGESNGRKVLEGPNKT